MELVEGEKVAVSGGDSGEEMDDGPLEESFSIKLLFSPSGKTPTQTSGTIVYATTAIICKCAREEAKHGSGNVHIFPIIISNSRVSPPPAAVLITVLCIVLANCLPMLLDGHAAVILTCVILGLLCIMCVIIIWRQPESREALTFKVTIDRSHHGRDDAAAGGFNMYRRLCPLKVPLLPWLPLFSVFVNIYLMMQLDRGTWIRFTVWMVVGQSSLTAACSLSCDRVITCCCLAPPPCRFRHLLLLRY